MATFEAASCFPEPVAVARVGAVLEPAEVPEELPEPPLGLELGEPEGATTDGPAVVPLGAELEGPGVTEPDPGGCVVVGDGALWVGGDGGALWVDGDGGWAGAVDSGGGVELLPPGLMGTTCDTGVPILLQ